MEILEEKIHILKIIQNEILCFWTQSPPSFHPADKNVGLIFLQKKMQTKTKNTQQLPKSLRF